MNGVVSTSSSYSKPARGIERVLAKAKSASGCGPAHAHYSAIGRGGHLPGNRRGAGYHSANISLWKKRYLEEGLVGLGTIRPGQPPRKLTPALRAKILARTQQLPPDGSTHWRLRKMAAVMGVGKELIRKVWQEADLKPHRLERYMASKDPAFEQKAAAIIGLYLNPPQHAAVFCIDEKRAIQALDRLDRRLPLSPGRAERHGFEYYRHGTLSLFAALNPQTGEVRFAEQPTHGLLQSSHPYQRRAAPWIKDSSGGHHAVRLELYAGARQR
jgi:hypothetical protein